MNVREAAFISLMRCEDAGKFSDIEIDSAIKKYGLDGRDKAFFTTLVYGVIEKKINLDYIIGKFSSIPTDKIEPHILCILRLGAYQIMYLNLPDRAAVNESVELAKIKSHKGADKFVNAVLRAIARGKDKIEYPDPKVDRAFYLSVMYSFPLELCEMWERMYGEEQAESMLRAFDCHPKITLRTNTLKISRDDLMLRLRERGIACDATPLSPYGIKLSGFVPTSEISELEEGLCFVQDEASQLCAKAAGAMPGDFVIDTCACPGGKTFSSAINMENRGRIVAMDLHKSKLSLIEKGAVRLGISVIETMEQNGRNPREEFFGKADRVICDAPCSGLGVIAKKPDLRSKGLDDLARLPEIQYAILDGASKYVKVGGTLLYSTCTLNRAENEDVAARFLREHEDFAPCSDLMPENSASITLFPDKNKTDGFFMAKFARKE